MGFVSHIKKNIVKYLVYFFTIIIAYGLIEYVFFTPQLEGLKDYEKMQIEASIKKEVNKSNKKLFDKDSNQDKEINSMKKTIIDLEEEMDEMKNSAEESKAEAENAKAEVLESAPNME